VRVMGIANRLVRVNVKWQIQNLDWNCRCRGSGQGSNQPDGEADAVGSGYCRGCIGGEWGV